MEQIKNNDIFANIIEHSKDLLFSMDKYGNLLSVNSLCEQLYIGKFEIKTPVKAFIPESVYRKIRSALLISLKKKEPVFEHEIELYSKDGRFHVYELMILPEYKNNKLFEFFGIAHNITNLKSLHYKELIQIIESEENNKKNIAEEIHDRLGSTLSAMNIYLGILMKKNISDSEREKHYEQIKVLLSDVIYNIRNITNNISPNLLNDFGLISSVRSLVKKINETRNGIIAYYDQGEEIKIDRIIELNLYRIILELLNNSWKHADATSISFKLLNYPDRIYLRYADNGKGFNVQKILSLDKFSTGLKNIITRIKIINGTLDISSKIKKGTTIEIIVQKITL